MYKTILILLFPCLIFAQWNEWSGWGSSGDKTPPTAPTVILAKNGADSVDATVDFNAASDIDSIFARSDTTSRPTTKTSGDSVYAGTDTSVVNSLTLAHGVNDEATYYLSVFVQDSVPNITYGYGSVEVGDTTAPSAPTIASFDTLGTDSTELLLNTFAQEANVHYWICFDDTLTGLDSTNADSVIHSTDTTAIATVHWKHSLADGGYLYVKIDYADSLYNYASSLTDSFYYDPTPPAEETVFNYTLNFILR